MTATSQTARPSDGRSSEESSAGSLKSPRAARFAEATTIISPIKPKEASPFADPPQREQGKPDVSDVGFGYMDVNQGGQNAAQARLPPATPLKSALKTPGSVSRNFNLLSPTFKEEYVLDKQEKKTEKKNEKDLVSGGTPTDDPTVLQASSSSTLTRSHLRKSKPASAQPRLFFAL